MAARPRNHYRAWTQGELRQLRALAKARTPSKLIARRLKRTLFAVYSKMKHERIVLASALKRQAPRSTSRRRLIKTGLASALGKTSASMLG
jgi:hypothetical protein